MPGRSTGWFCLWLSPRYRVEADRVTITRSPLVWLCLAGVPIGLVMVAIAWPTDGHSMQHFATLWWGAAIAGFSLFGVMSASWFPGRVVIAPGVVEWGSSRYSRAEIANLTATGHVNRMRGHVGSYRRPSSSSP